MNTKNQVYSPWVRWIFLATTIEYIIFGIIDPFYALFVQSIVDNYFLVGVVFGIRSLIGIISVFFFTRIFSVLPPIQALFIAQCFVFLGFLGFFFTGVFESIILLFLFAILNGFAFMLKQSAKQNILMNEITGKNASRVMGINIALRYTCWSIGMFLGGMMLFFVGDIPIHYAYLAISGVWLLGLLIFFEHFNQFIAFPWKAVQKSMADVIQKDGLCMRLFSKAKNFSSPLNYSIALCFFMEMTSRVSLLFVPLLAQSLGLPLWQIFCLTGFMLFPMIFTFVFSRLADSYNKLTLIIYGIAFSLFPLLFLSTTTSPISIAIASSVISLCIALLQPSVLGLAGSMAPRTEKNSVVQLELFATSMGAIVGGVGLGAIAEVYGIQMSFMMVACIAVIFLCTAIWLHFYLEKTPLAQKYNQPKTVYQKVIEATQFTFRRHL